MREHTNNSNCWCGPFVKEVWGNLELVHVIEAQRARVAKASDLDYFNIRFITSGSPPDGA